jgi:hypothetical protein
MNARNLSSRILVTVGGIAMLVGAIDPMEGSILILPAAAWSRLAPASAKTNAEWSHSGCWSSRLLRLEWPHYGG